MEQRQEFSRPEIDLLKNTIAKGCSDAEFRLFIRVAEKLQLDPFARQIFVVPRWDSNIRANVMTPMVSIDGSRLVASRTGQYQGQTPPEWCGQDGKWVEVWLGDGPPAAARVGILHRDFKAPLYAVARYASYVQRTKEGKPTKIWAGMPDNMLSKCAESLALRKAFPNDLSSLYTEEEMGQSLNDQRELSASAQKNIKPVDVPVAPHALQQGARFHHADVAAMNDAMAYVERVTAPAAAQTVHAVPVQAVTAQEAPPPPPVPTPAPVQSEPPHDEATGEVQPTSLADLLAGRISVAQSIRPDLTGIAADAELAHSRGILTQGERDTVFAQLSTRKSALIEQAGGVATKTTHVVEEHAARGTLTEETRP